jgi:polyisoprenoid-binding protein YceI
VLKKLAAGAVVVLVAVGAAVWWFVLRDDSPPPPELTDTGETTGDQAVSGELDGTWALVADDAHYAGYRIPELFGGDTLKRDAVARTGAVTGELTIEGDQLIAVQITADLTALESEDPTAGRRDRYLQGNALEVETFPEATFTLTDPVDLAPLPAERQPATYEITGDLTLHGVTAPVAVSLDTSWDGDTIEVAGSAPVTLADFDIDAPDVPGLAKVDEVGAFEVLLLFERPAG